MLKIHAKQNINFELANWIVKTECILMAIKLLLKTQIMFLKTLENTTEIKNVKY